MNSKYTLTFYLLLLTITFQKTFSMEITTTITDPTLVGFLNDNKIIIGGRNGFEIVNPRTKQSLKREIPNSRIHDLTVNASRTKFAVSIDGKIIRYNAETYEQEWEYETSEPTWIPIVFNSQNDTKLMTVI